MKFKISVLGGIVALATSTAALAQPAPAAPSQPATALLSAVVMVSNMDRALRFYTKGIGLSAPVVLRHPKAVEAPLVFPGGGPTLLLEQHLTPAASGTALPEGRVVISVPDLHAVEQRLTAAGYALSAPIADHPPEHVLVAKILDPDGNQIEFVQKPH